MLLLDQSHLSISSPAAASLAACREAHIASVPDLDAIVSPTCLLCIVDGLYQPP